MLLVSGVMTRVLRSGVVGCVVALLAVSAAAAATERLTTSYGGDEHVTAYGGHVVWSQYEPSSNRWTLQQWYRGRQMRLPVLSRDVPFDVDAGPDVHGRPAVVFSRCTAEPVGKPDWGESRGCHIHQLTLEPMGRERVVRRLFKANRSDTTPSIWRGRVAFARRVFHGIRARYPRIFLGLPDGSTRRLGRGTLGFDGNRDVPRIEVDSWADVLDLGPKRLALLWRYPSGGSGLGSELWLDRLTGRRHDLLGGTGFTEGECEFGDVSSPNVLGTRVIFALVHHDSDCVRETGYFVSAAARRDPRISKPSGIPLAIARDGATTYWISRPVGAACPTQPDACSLIRSSSLSWQPETQPLPGVQ